MTDLLTPPANTTAPAPAPAAARDFTKKRRPLTFTIDDDHFEATAALPGDVFAEFVTTYNGTSETETYQQQHDLLKAALQMVLLPASWERFAARLRDKTHPIDDDQMSDVVLWLLEEYGMRPTRPSQDSSDGSASPESGTSSTESTPPEAPTSPASQPTDS